MSIFEEENLGQELISELEQTERDEVLEKMNIEINGGIYE